MDIGSYEYIEKNNIWRLEYVEEIIDDPDGCCSLHYLSTTKKDRCDMYKQHPKKGDILMGSCNGCKYFIKSIG